MLVNKNDKDWNYTLFVSTINSLKHSNGSYGRMARDLSEMTDEAKQKLKDNLAKLPKFKDEVDVVLYLES